MINKEEIEAKSSEFEIHIAHVSQIVMTGSHIYTRAAPSVAQLLGSWFESMSGSQLIQMTQ